MALEKKAAGLVSVLVSATAMAMAKATAKDWGLVSGLALEKKAAGLASVLVSAMAMATATATAVAALVWGSVLAESKTTKRGGSAG